jgi:hypothetical protein
MRALYGNVLATFTYQEYILIGAKSSVEVLRTHGFGYEVFNFGWHIF